MADPTQTPLLKLKKQYAQALLDAGLTYKKIARIVSAKYGPVVATTVEKWMERGYLKRSPLPFRVYNDYFRLKGNWWITSDWHIPFVDETLLEHLIEMRKRFKDVPNLLIAGDFLDEVMFSEYFIEEEGDFGQELEIAREILAKLNNHFEDIRFLMGNHDARLLRLLRFRLGTEDFSRLIAEGMKISDYPYCLINNSWWITHPKTYSKLATRVAFQLTHKRKKHVGVAHGHNMGVTYSPSGEDLCFDTGGLLDPSKISYKNLQETTHGEWISGFSMIRENFLYQFPSKLTDWNFWLKK